MKIDAEVFSKFLEGLSLSGEESIDIKECIFRGTSERLTAIVVTPGKAVIVSAELLGDYSSLGDFGIANLPLLKKMISTCKGELDISVTANKFRIMSGKKLKVDLVLSNLQYIANELDKAKFDVLVTKASGNSFTLEKNTLEEFKKYYTVFGKELLISGKNNEITFNMDSGENSLDLTIEVPETVKKFSVKLAGMLMRILSVIKTDSISVSINDGANVILLNSKSDNYAIKYLVAPMVK